MRAVTPTDSSWPVFIEQLEWSGNLTIRARLGRHANHTEPPADGIDRPSVTGPSPTVSEAVRGRVSQPSVNLMSRTVTRIPTVSTPQQHCPTTRRARRRVSATSGYWAHIHMPCTIAEADVRFLPERIQTPRAVLTGALSGRTCASTRSSAEMPITSRPGWWCPRCCGGGFQKIVRGSRAPGPVRVGLPVRGRGRADQGSVPDSGGSDPGSPVRGSGSGSDPE